MSFCCPRCQMTSHHPKDEEHGYCGACHDFTGDNHFELHQGQIIDWKMEAERANRLYANIERINRVDNALAKRVGAMIERNSAIKVALTQWLRAYPLSIFPEPDLEKAAELLKAGGQTLDSVSANMARHVLSRVIEMFDDEKIIG